MDLAKQPIWQRAVLGILALILLIFTAPAYIDTANNPGLANLSGEVASLGSVAGAFLARQLGLVLIAIYGAVNGTRQAVMLGAFGIGFFNLHDAVFLTLFGEGGIGAITGLIIGGIAMAVAVIAARQSS